jgi:hypothetical protein
VEGYRVIQGTYEGGQHMRNRLILLAAVVAAGLVAAVAAWAGNPHFLSIGSAQLVSGSTATATATATSAAKLAADASSTGTDPRVFIDNIVVVGVKAGVTVQLTAPFQAVYVCVNGGKNVPSAANKTILAGQISASSQFTADRNGRATGSLLTGSLPTSAEAAAATGFACPSGQRLEFDRVVFSGLVLSIVGGESVTLEATLASESLHGLSG